MRPDVLYHFSTDPHIKRFAPHVPRTNPSHPPAVWAIDHQHAPLYWFPRDCPRVSVWARNPGETVEFQDRFATSATRVHAVESAWLGRMRESTIYRYEFDAAAFVPWEDATGQWISDREIVPLSVTQIEDLLAAHVDASIELHIVPLLWPLHDLVRQSRFDFSLVRMHNAQPRPSS